MDGVTLGLLVVIIIIIILYRPFGNKINAAIVLAVGSVGLWLLDDSQHTKIAGAPRLAGPMGVVRRPGGKIRRLFKDALRNAKQALVAGSAGAAALGSFGAGGDTIVEVLALMLDCGAYLGELAVIFLGDIGASGDSLSIMAALQHIWKIDFTNGVDGVRLAMIDLHDRAGEGASQLFGSLREIYSSFIEWMLTMFGRAISALIPDDASVVGWLFGETLIAAIRMAAGNVFWIMNAIYNKIVPSGVREILQNPEQLRNLIVTILSFVQQYILTNGDESWAVWAGKHIGRQALVAATGTIVLLAGSVVAAPVAIPAALMIALGGSIINVMSSSGLGREQIRSIIDALHTRKFTVVGLGDMTAVDALVMFIGKVVPLTFAGMFLLSDYTAVADVEPIVEDGVVRSTTVTVTEPGAPVAELHDLPDRYANAHAAQDTNGIDIMLDEIAGS